MSNLENLSKIAKVGDFDDAYSLKETLFKSLPIILKYLRKIRFRPSLSLFIDPLFENARNEKHEKMAIVCQEFILELRESYPGLFKDLVKKHNESYFEDIKKYKVLKEQRKDKLIFW